MLTIIIVQGQTIDSTVTQVSQPANGIEQLAVQLDSTPNLSSAIQDIEAAYVYDSLWLNKLYKTNQYFNEMQQELVSDSIPEFAAIPTDTLKQRLQRLNERTPLNITYNPSLEQVINRFLKHRRPLMQKMLRLSQFYFPMFEESLAAYDIPLEIKYLAIVESALNPRAKSPVGATGLWQFMFSTGKMHGLDVNSYVDERSDPIKSTEAACKYLSTLYGIYNDWDLALAAYNSGPGNVNKAIRRSGGYKNYWNIRMFLPRETAGYVPAFIATMYIFEYAKQHDFSYEPVERPYFATDTVHIKNMVTFEQLSELLAIEENQLEQLNPAYKLNIIPKVKGKNIRPTFT